MGPKYEVKQVGVVGESNTVTGNTFRQVWSGRKDDIDLRKLADELARLREVLKSESAQVADDGGHDLAIGAIRLAEKEAREGNARRKRPRNTSSSQECWEMGVVGGRKNWVGVATAAIKAALGL